MPNTFFDSVTHVVSWLIGLGLLIFFGALLFLEMKSPPAHTVHLAMFSGGIVLALIVMGFASPIAAGLQAIGGAVGQYLPWKRGGAS